MFVVPRSSEDEISRGVLGRLAEHSKVPLKDPGDPQHLPGSVWPPMCVGRRVQPYRPCRSGSLVSVDVRLEGMLGAAFSAPFPLRSATSRFNP